MLNKVEFEKLVTECDRAVVFVQSGTEIMVGVKGNLAELIEAIARSIIHIADNTKKPSCDSEVASKNIQMLISLTIDQIMQESQASSEE